MPAALQFPLLFERDGFPSSRARCTPSCMHHYRLAEHGWWCWCPDVQHQRSTQHAGIPTIMWLDTATRRATEEDELQKNCLFLFTKKLNCCHLNSSCQSLTNVCLRRNDMSNQKTSAKQSLVSPLTPQIFVTSLQLRRVITVNKDQVQ